MGERKLMTRGTSYTRDVISRTMGAQLLELRGSVAQLLGLRGLKLLRIVQGQRPRS